MYDKEMRRDFKINKGSVIGWLLMASWIYYNKPNSPPILSDSVFDNACKWLYDHFDEVNHKYKDLVVRDDLKAGSLFSIPTYSYPQFIIHLAELLTEEKDEFLYYED